MVAWLLDTKTGKFTDLSKLLAAKVKKKGLICVGIALSPSGEFVALAACDTAVLKAAGPGKALTQTVYLLKRADGSIRKVADGLAVPPIWNGGKVYVHRGGEKVGPVTEIDAATGKERIIKIGGIVFGTGPDGKSLLAACDPAAPTKPVPPKAFDRAELVIVTPGGKVLWQMEGFQDMAGLLRLSPGGKYLAFGREKWLEDPSPPKWLGVQVMSWGGKVKRTIKDYGDALAVTDGGEVVLRMHDEPKHGGLLKLVKLDGSSRVLVKVSQAAGVGGGRLFYVIEGGKTHVLKVVSLELEKPKK